MEGGTALSTKINGTGKWDFEAKLEDQRIIKSKGATCIQDKNYVMVEKFNQCSIYVCEKDTCPTTCTKEDLANG